MTVEAASEQRRVEELFGESAHNYEEKRRRQHARQWIDYHQRQQRALEATFVLLMDRHRSEQDRYRQLLNGISTTEGES